MKIKDFKQLQHRVSRNAELVIQTKDGLYSSWPMEIKYTSEGKWIVLIKLEDKK